MKKTTVALFLLLFTAPAFAEICGINNYFLTLNPLYGPQQDAAVINSIRHSTFNNASFGLGIDYKVEEDNCWYARRYLLDNNIIKDESEFDCQDIRAWKKDANTTYRFNNECSLVQVQVQPTCGAADSELTINNGQKIPLMEVLTRIQKQSTGQSENILVVETHENTYFKIPESKPNNWLPVEPNEVLRNKFFNGGQQFHNPKFYYIDFGSADMILGFEIENEVTEYDTLKIYVNNNDKDYDDSNVLTTCNSGKYLLIDTIDAAKFTPANKLLWRNINQSFDDLNKTALKLEETELNEENIEAHLKEITQFHKKINESRDLLLLSSTFLNTQETFIRRMTLPEEFKQYLLNIYLEEWRNRLSTVISINLQKIGEYENRAEEITRKAERKEDEINQAKQEQRERDFTEETNLKIIIATLIVAIFSTAFGAFLTQKNAEIKEKLKSNWAGLLLTLSIFSAIILFTIFQGITKELLFFVLFIGIFGSLIAYWLYSIYESINQQIDIKKTIKAPFQKIWNNVMQKKKSKKSKRDS